MRSFRLATVAVMVAVFGLMTVSAASAQYAQCMVTEFDVDPDSLEGSGEVDGEAEADVEGGTFNIENDFDGQTESGGNPTSFSFSFPEVDEEEDVTITAIYTTPDDQTCQASVTITLVPEDDDDDGDGDGGGDDSNGGLPDTGGTDERAIALGTTLLLIGGGTVFLMRRRNEDTA